jgi:hypothetical protein
VKGAKWARGSKITVSFLDGDPAVRAKVQAVAQQWTGPQLANLNLEFRTDTTDTLVRISFRYQGSWSTIGTTCRQVTDKTRPTMNYGWLTASSSAEEIQRVVLHEFGHALGLIHEHQNPGGVIHWNREQVINDLSGYPNYWSLDTIELNMFRTYATAETNFSALDPESIIMYPLPSRWTTDGFSVGLNSKLSDTDKRFIREQYPS